MCYRAACLRRVGFGGYTAAPTRPAQHARHGPDAAIATAQMHHPQQPQRAQQAQQAQHALHMALTPHGLRRRGHPLPDGILALLQPQGDSPPLQHAQIGVRASHCRLGRGAVAQQPRGRAGLRGPGGAGAGRQAVLSERPGARRLNSSACTVHARAAHGAEEGLGANAVGNSTAAGLCSWAKANNPVPNTRPTL